MDQPKHYFPEPGKWLETGPEETGFDPGRLDDAVRFAVETEIRWPKDIGAIVARTDPEPYNKILGPTKERGPAAGLIIKNGYVVAKWGSVDRVDMTFSATKSYISVLVGLAVDRGLIKSTSDYLADYVKEGLFESKHNRRIKWEHLLQQTSEWEGELFGIPDTVDHNRSVQGGADKTVKKGEKRELKAPGDYWEYNDVRVNLLALALLHVIKEPLPEVLKRSIMDPVGASDSWDWHAYRNADVEIDEKVMPSVPGGAHWGGGLFISAYDHARLGYLMLRQGNWNGKQIISRQWIEQSMVPCKLNPQYGFMWWLNTGQSMFEAASEKAFSAMGAGGNVVFMDPEFDLVIVTRWAGKSAEVINRVIDSLKEGTG
ncbi:MAG: serine hydrolase [Deltaproteobacteria bacterium]|nr:serine hydrolase [Deltaproteobacteria bacterium]